MPYVYKHDYETVGDVKKEFGDPRKHSISTKYFDSVVERERIKHALDREEYLETLEFQDQMAARYITLDVDLRNKYSIKNALRILNAALESVENEVFAVPYDAPHIY